MSILSWFFHKKCIRAAIVDENKDRLDNTIKSIKSQYNGQFSVEGFTNYDDLFLKINLNKARKIPFDVAIIKENCDSKMVSCILSKTDPNIMFINCKDSENINEKLPALLW